MKLEEMLQLLALLLWVLLAIGIFELMANAYI